MEMPDKLNLFLQTLSDEDKEATYKYLDGDPDAVHEMLKLVVKPWIPPTRAPWDWRNI